MPSDLGPRRVDPVDRAHLTGLSRPSPPIYRYAPGPGLEALVMRYWVPVWTLDAPQTQSTLQHPCCLIVVSNTYARFYGVAHGLSSVTLERVGWAVGTMLAPGAGAHLLGSSVATLNDTHVDLDQVGTLDGAALTDAIHAAMTTDPSGETSHLRAIAALECRLRPHLPLDEPGRLVNRVVAWLDQHPDVTRVADVARQFAVSERSLQRLVEHRTGMTPKWLIMRRRLHDAVQRLKAGGVSLTDLATELGYADQAHFTHDFRAVTGQTPGEYLGDQSASE